MSLVQGNTAGAMGSFFGIAKDMFGANRTHEKAKKTKGSSADVIQWSGCKDDQTVRGIDGHTGWVIDDTLIGQCGHRPDGGVHCRTSKRTV